MEPFTDGGVSDKEGELAQRYSVRPEPADRLGRDVGEFDDDGA